MGHVQTVQYLPKPPEGEKGLCVFFHVQNRGCTEGAHCKRIHALTNRDCVEVTESERKAAYKLMIEANRAKDQKVRSDRASSYYGNNGGWGGGNWSYGR